MRKHQPRFVVLIGATLTGLVATAGTASADCPAKIAEVRRLVQAHQLAAAGDHVAAMKAAIDCGDDEVRSAESDFANGLVSEARRLSADPSKGDAVAALVSQAAALKDSWGAMKAVGDWQSSHKHYKDAADFYQLAINLIETYETNDKIATLRPKIEDIERRASEAVYLASDDPNGQPVRAPARATGGIGGVYSPIAGIGVRGPVGEKLYPTPIKFVFDKADFTPEGSRAAAEVLSLLEERKPVTITVVGHTDQKGDDAYNVVLSQRRADTVKNYLTQNQIAGTIVAIGKGKSEPRVLADPSIYTQDEINALNRRVEVLIKVPE